MLQSFMRIKKKKQTYYKTQEHLFLSEKKFEH